MDDKAPCTALTLRLVGKLCVWLLPKTFALRGVGRGDRHIAC